MNNMSFELKDKPDFVKKYEKTLQQNESKYFDVDELIDLIEYYHDLRKREQQSAILNLAEKLHPDNDIWLLLRARLYIDMDSPAYLYNELLNKFSDKKDELFIVLKVRAYLFQKMIDEAEEFTVNYLSGIQDKPKKYSRMTTQLAYAFLEKGIYYMAEALFNNSNSLSTDDYLRFAFCCEQTKNVKKAVEIYKLCKNESIEALISLGAIYTHQKEYAKADLVLQDAINRDPYNKMAWFNLGILQAEKEQYEEALESFNFAIAIDDNDHLALFNKAHTLYQLEKWTEAKNIYAELLESKSIEKWKVELCLAECLENLQEYPKALGYYFEAFKKHRHHYSILVGMAYSHLQIGNYNDTVAFAKRALEVDDNQPDAWEYMGEALMFLDKIDEAVLAYEKAFKLEPTDKNLLFTLGTLYLDTKKYELAKKHFILAYKYDPTIPNIEVMIAVSYFYLKDYDQMLSYLNLAENRNLDASKSFLEFCPEAKYLFTK